MPNIRESLGRELHLELEFITIEFGLAPVVPILNQFIPMHETSLANAHQQARQHADTFTRRHHTTAA